MGNGRLDVIIFGATGFTGKYVVREFVKIGHNKFSWGIAGRNIDKLKELLNTVSSMTGNDITKIPIIVADCGDFDSLCSMASKGRVVIDCCGPYRFYGEQIVKACVENGTHHLDVSGEPEFMEKVQLNYHEDAQEKNVYIISSCGLDSVPVDLGIVHFVNNFEGQVNSVESYMKISSTNKNYTPVCNYATWESAVHGFSNASNLISIRKQLYSKFARPKLEPRMAQRPTIHKSEVFDNKYSIPFPGSDRSVVNRSQLYIHSLYNQRPVQYAAYLVCENTLVLLGIMLVGYFLQTLTKYEFGRKVLLNYPQLFSLGLMSRDGPTEEEAANSTVIIKFCGEGWLLNDVKQSSNINIPPNKTMITEFKCRNIAYGFTATCVILCAITILTESEKMPLKGGVYTPAAAFSKTSLIENLCKHGASFTVLETRTK